jgi:hypothetical protein
VSSETRAACCMLWVTITIVYRALSPIISSSIRAVAIGSRAEQGSSIRSTSGSTATSREMQSRCCCSGASERAEVPRRSLSVSQSAVARRAVSTRPSSSRRLPASPWIFGP